MSENPCSVCAKCRKNPDGPNNCKPEDCLFPYQRIRELQAREARWKKLAKEMASLITSACPDASLWTDPDGIGAEYDRMTSG
jgi:hypothetical protein